MTFEEALAYMQGLHRFGIKLGNERFEALLERLGNPHRRYDIAHVAGTKGKGSTTAMIAAMLQAHGFRVGGYFSPYVYDVRERVQVDAQMIPAADFARLVTEIQPHIEALKETPLGQTTEFELKTAVGFRYFADRAVDFAAVEVGLGGRLDATNVVAPRVCVITNIDLDHTHILGDTHARIAAEKAGIIKPGVPVITATEEPSALEVICRIAAERNAPLVRVGPGGPDMRPASNDIHWFAENGTGEPMTGDRDEGGSFTIRTWQRDYPGLRLRLRGDYQRINAACAIGALEAMAGGGHLPNAERRVPSAIELDAVREGLRRAYLPGRLEVVHRRPIVVMDGAHNALAARALSTEIGRFAYRRLLLVIGLIAGHTPESVLPPLASLAAKVFATRPTWLRGLPAEEVAEVARRYCAQVETRTPPLSAARAALAEAGPEDLVLITGSFYTVGDVPPERLF